MSGALARSFAPCWFGLRGCVRACVSRVTGMLLVARAGAVGVQCDWLGAWQVDVVCWAFCWRERVNDIRGSIKIRGRMYVCIARDARRVGGLFVPVCAGLGCAVLCYSSSSYHVQPIRKRTRLPLSDTLWPTVMLVKLWLTPRERRHHQLHSARLEMFSILPNTHTHTASPLPFVGPPAQWLRKLSESECSVNVLAIFQIRKILSAPVHACRATNP